MVFPSGEVELARLVDMSAEAKRVRIEYDSSVVKGTVTIRGVASLSIEELWELTESALAARGFATVQSQAKGTLSVVRVTEAMGAAAPRDEASPAGTASFVCEIDEAKSQPVKSLIEAVKPLLSKQGGSIAPLGDSKFFLIADFEPRLKAIRQLLETIDVPGDPIVAEILPLRSLTAPQAVAMLDQVVAAMGPEGRTRLGGKAIAGPGQNTLLVVAPQGDLVEWKALIDRLDLRAPVRTSTYTAGRVPVRDLAKLIESIVKDPRVPDDRWRMVVDEISGSLIVTATEQ